MQIGDLVKYYKSSNILVIVGMKEKHGGKKSMIRCFCAHLKDYYWFWEDDLEVLDESR